MSATYDSVQLENSTYIPQYVRHESMPTREIERLPASREDGSTVISDRFGEKVIEVRGTLVGSSKSDLESRLDTLKELLSRQAKNLDVDYAGSTRRYVAYPFDFVMERDHYHINAAPYSVKFLVPSGMGEATSETTVVNASALTTTTPVTGSFTLGGTAEQLPIIELKITGSGWTNAKGLKFKKTDNGQFIIIETTEAVANGTVFKIDCKNKRVTFKFSTTSPEYDINFLGEFPTFLPGVNNYEISVGEIAIEAFFDGTVTDLDQYEPGDNITWIAQSFTLPYRSTTVKGARLVVKAVAALTGNTFLHIRTDNNGQPSVSTVTNGDITESVDNYPTTIGWHTFKRTSGQFITLEAATPYWVLLQPPGSLGSIGDFEQGYVSSSKNAAFGRYGKGKAMTTTDGGTNWTDPAAGTSVAFEILFAGERETSSLELTVKNTNRYL
jgi:phage-related protein